MLFFTVLLASIIIPNLIRPEGSGQYSACKTQLVNIGTACDMYSTDWSGHYPNSLQALTPNYLKTIPTCFAAGADTYSLTYKKSLGGDPSEEHIEIFCGGHFHKEISAANHPRWNDSEGIIEQEPNS